jgi:hypothetical protein
MSETVITERQQYWLNHIRSADASEGTLVDYAKAQSLKVKDLYQWKTLLVRRGVMSGKSAQQKAFVAVRESVTASKAALVLPNGARLEFSGAVDAETIQSLVTAASSLGSSALG